MRVVAMVPVRGGSQRVPRKNSRPFSDTTLLDLKLDVLKGVAGLDDIVVTTDCPECMSIADQRGVTTHRREPHFASSTITNDQHWRHIAEITPGDVVFMTQVTSPLVRRSTHVSALRGYIENLERHDSMNSVTLEKKFLWADGRPINYSADKTPRSQDLPDIFSLNFAITIIDKALMVERGNVVGKVPQFITLDKVESLDIDDEEDFSAAEDLFRRLGRDWLCA